MVSADGKKAEKAKVKLQAFKALASRLGALKVSHTEMAKAFLVAQDGAFYASDLVALAVLQRSLRLIDGFLPMIERRNYLCAVPLFRLQIDSLLRFYALWVVRDATDVANQLLKDKPFNKIKSTDGSQLTDTYLCKQLSAKLPWVTSAYKLACSYVHLSGQHIAAYTTGAKRQENIVSLCISKGTCEKWSDEHYAYLLNAFYEATVALLEMCQSQLEYKESFPSPEDQSQSESMDSKASRGSH